MTEERSCEVGRNGKKTARAAFGQVGLRKSGMGRVTYQVPAGRVSPSLQFRREYQTGEFGLPVGLPRRVYALALQIIEIDEDGPVRQTADADDSCAA